MLHSRRQRLKNIKGVQAIEFIRILRARTLYNILTAINMELEQDSFEFPLCGTAGDIDYLDCEMANNWNTGNTLSEENQDLDLSIDSIED